MSGCYRSSEMDRPDRAEPAIESFIREEAHDLEDWRWLWEGDHPFPLESHRPGLAGRLVLAIKRALRPLVRAPQADLCDRQRAYNKVLAYDITRMSNLKIASWLPFFHDMGFVSNLLLTLYNGGEMAFIDPFDWVDQPLSLFHIIDEQKSNLVWMPNFAYRHLT